MLVGSRVYAIDVSGVMHIFRAGPAYVEIGTVEMGEPMNRMCVGVVYWMSRRIRPDQSIQTTNDMKTKTFTKMTAGVFALAFVLAGTATSKAGHGERDLVRLAHEAEDHAEDLRDEFKRHFKHSGSYKHLM